MFQDRVPGRVGVMDKGRSPGESGILLWDAFEIIWVMGLSVI